MAEDGISRMVEEHYLGLHHATVGRDSAIQDGRLRDCGHMKIYQRDANPLYPKYMLRCLRNSFNRTPNRAPSYVSCPPTCELFETNEQVEATKAKEAEEEASRQRQGRRKDFVSKLLSSPRRFFAWFASAPWQTQLVIILLVVWLVAPRVLGPLGRMLAIAIHGNVIEETTEIQ